MFVTLLSKSILGCRHGNGDWRENAAPSIVAAPAEQSASLQAGLLLLALSMSHS